MRRFLFGLLVVPALAFGLSLPGGSGLRLPGLGRGGGLSEVPEGVPPGLLAGGRAGYGGGRALAGTPSPALAAPGGAGPFVRLAYAVFDPLRSLPRLPRDLRSEPSPGKPSYFLLQFRRPVARAERAGLEALGLQQVGAFPDYTLVVRATPEAVGRARLLPAVRWAGHFEPAYKIPKGDREHPGLLQLKGEREFRVWLWPGEDTARWARALAGIRGVKVLGTSSSGRLVRIRAEARLLPAVARLEGVEWISGKAEGVLLNTNARWVTQSAVPASTPLFDRGLNGSGQVVGVADTGLTYYPDAIGEANVYFSDCSGTTCKKADYLMKEPGNQEKLKELVATGSRHRKVAAYLDLVGDGLFDSGPSTHGTHVAGSVAGSRPPYDGRQPWDGIAPAARIAFQDVGDRDESLAGLPADQYDLFDQVYDLNGNKIYDPDLEPRVHNNSYGLIVPALDLGDSIRTDDFVWDHPDFTVIISAGNSGPGLASVGSPALAKNAITSAAGANGYMDYVSLDALANFSSHGPTADGRIKPDLVTPGMMIISPKGSTHDEVQVLQGTSMSGPILAGNAALVRQYYMQYFGPLDPSSFSGTARGLAGAGGFNPSSALVRATLVASAQRMRGAYTGDDGSQSALDGQWPSFGQGWGRVQLDQALAFPGSPFRLFAVDVPREKGIDTGGEASYRLQVAAGRPLKVALAWVDGSNPLPVGTPVLVNDLDLEVVAPDGTVYPGNSFASRLDPRAESSSLAGGAGDHTNNVEVVQILDPVPGTWEIRVKGTNLLEGPSGFALAATGLLGGAGAPAPPTPGPAPRITSISLSAPSSDLAVVSFGTEVPSLGEVEVKGPGLSRVQKDVYSTSGYPGLEADFSETRGEFLDRPVVAREHQVKLSGLAPGTEYEIILRARDPVDPSRATEVVRKVRTPATVFAPTRASETATLFSGDTTFSLVPDTGDPWGASSQLYAGSLPTTVGLVLPSTGDRIEILSAFKVHVPSGLDLSRVVGAYLLVASRHDITSRVFDEPVYQVDLLDVGPGDPWGPGTSYSQVKGYRAAATLTPRTGYRRVAGAWYAFSLSCNDLQTLKAKLGQGEAAFRVSARVKEAESIFAWELGFGRRARGIEWRPRLVLVTADSPNPLEVPGTGRGPAISDVRVQEVDEGKVTVSWLTDVPSDSEVIYRRGGTQDPFTVVGSPAFVTDHLVQVSGLEPAGAYEFAVRSTTPDGHSSLADAGGRGYALYPDPYLPPRISAVSAQSAFNPDGPPQAQVRFTTDQPATGRIRYGTRPDALTEVLEEKDDPATEEREDLKTEHSFTLTGLAGCTRYFFQVEAANRVGARSSSAVFSFDTPPQTSKTLAGPYSFEAGEEGWEVKTTQGALGWQRQPPGQDGLISFAVSPYTDETVTYLISPTVKLPGGGGVLEFWGRLDLEPDFDFLAVLVSRDGGRTFAELAKFTGSNPDWPDFSRYRVDLPPALGGDVRFAFRLTSDGLISSPLYTGVAVDSIRVVVPEACPSVAGSELGGNPAPAQAEAEAAGVPPPAPRPAVMAAGSGGFASARPDERSLAAGTASCVLAARAGAPAVSPTPGAGPTGVLPVTGAGAGAAGIGLLLLGASVGARRRLANPPG